MPAWLSAQRLVKVGLALLLGATAVALFLMFFDSFVGGISPILVVAVPLSVLAALFGFIATLVGTMSWAFQTTTRKLASFGIALIGLGMACFLIIDRIQFGFDDPRVLFAQLITGTPILVGALFLLFAGIRHLRAIYPRATK